LKRKHTFLNNFTTGKDNFTQGNVKVLDFVSQHT